MKIAQSDFTLSTPILSQDEIIATKSDIDNNTIENITNETINYNITFDYLIRIFL